MWDSRKMSFRSRHYPPKRPAFLVQQDFALRYYAILTFLVMVIVMLRINAGKEPLLTGIIGAALSFILANAIANIQLRKKVAEIFFVNDGFSVISIHSALNQIPAKSFPLRFANPTRTVNTIQFHYEDQIMILNRDDWGEDFELIWNWFNQSHLDFVSTT